MLQSAVVRPAPLPRAALATVTLALLAGAGVARAAGEAEWQLSARAGAAKVSLGSIDPRAPWGWGGALDLEYGVTDAWAARVSVATSVHPVDANMAARLEAGDVTASSAL